MKVLVTGFEPFGESDQNASMEIAKKLPKIIGGAEIEVCILPVIYGTCVELLVEEIEASHPDAVVCLGLAGGYTGIAVERYAFNLMNGSGRPDNSGVIREEVLIEADGPAAYASKLPIHEMVAAMRAGGVPAYINDVIGSYVCNNLMYGLLHYSHTQQQPILGGFIHVPFFTEQVIQRTKTASLPLDVMTRGIELAIGEVVKKL